METKQQYLNLLADKLTALYRDKQAGLATVSLRADLNGYLQAAMVLKGASNQELQQVIDDVYFKAYGKHRRDRDRTLDDAELNEENWAYFDKPKWER